MLARQARTLAFDPDFDDSEWTDGWRQVPILLPPPMAHPGGYRVVRRVADRVEVFGRAYRADPPVDCRLLLGPDGRLWMSSTPQEQVMMHNNGRVSTGHVLVGGLGLGMYPQYAAATGEATRFVVVERSLAVRAIVEPTLRAALDVPLEVRTGDVEALLAGPALTRYDTIFLDVWESLDAASLPAINRLRDQALRHLAPGGRLVIWGYRWTVRLFEDACRQLLAVTPAERRSWLLAQAGASPRAAALLLPVAARFQGRDVDDLEAALAWCRRYAARAGASWAGARDAEARLRAD